MQRLTTLQNEPIAEALEVIGPRLAGMLAGVDFLCGVDPVFAGLHRLRDTDDGTGRSYADTAACCFPWHTSDRSTTIVLPEWVGAEIVTHELGHALHHIVGWPVAVPINGYARTNPYEAFASAFSAYFWEGPGADWYDWDVAAARADRQTRALLDGLAVPSR